MTRALRGILVAIILSGAALAAWHLAGRGAVEAAPAASGSKVFNFDKDKAGALPAGWRMENMELGPRPKQPGSWKVVSDGKGKVLEGRGVVGTANDKSYLILNGPDVADADVSVRLRLVSTTHPEQHVWAGIVARYLSTANYYGVQMDWERQERVLELMYTLEDVNKEVFEKQTSIPFKYPTPWHTLRMRLEGPKLTFWFDDDKIFEGSHHLFATGKIGLFVADQSVVQFDDLKITQLPGKPAAPTAAGKTSTGWQHEPVAKSPGLFPQAAVVVDGNGLPHLATYDNAKGIYEHRWRQDGLWKTETVDDGKPSGAKYAESQVPPQQLLSLRVDADGNLHLLYARAASNAGAIKYGNSLGYAMRKGSMWSTGPLEFNDAVAWYPFLTFNEQWQPNALYYDIHSTKVEHAWQLPDGKWQLESTAGLESEAGRGSQFRVAGAVANDGTVQIAYQDEDKNALAVTQGRNGQYSTTYLSEEDRELGCYPSSARDSKGLMHVAHQDGVKQNLMYTTLVGGKWKTVTADDRRGTGIYSSIVIDGRDMPRIVYCDVTTGTIRYATHDGKTWQTEDTGLVGIQPQLALDTKGFPHVVYYDQMSRTLRYAHKEEVQGPPR